MMRPLLMSGLFDLQLKVMWLMASSIKLKRFYDSNEWRNLRMSLILIRGNTCQQCERTGFDSANLVGHHSPVELTNENVDNALISLNPDNVLIICRPCHDAEHTRFGQGIKQVFVVYGSPQSGRKTYVMGKKMANDLVVDIDALYIAVTGYGYGNKPNSLYKNVARLRTTMIDMITTRYGDWGTAWIIGTYADRYNREQIVNDTGATLIHIKTDKDECIRRLARNDKLRHRQAEWTGYINKYWDEYSE
jgi:hypothetical protein